MSKVSAISHTTAEMQNAEIDIDNHIVNHDNDHLQTQTQNESENQKFQTTVNSVNKEQDHNGDINKNIQKNIVNEVPKLQLNNNPSAKVVASIKEYLKVHYNDTAIIINRTKKNTSLLFTKKVYYVQGLNDGSIYKLKKEKQGLFDKKQPVKMTGKVYKTGKEVAAQVEAEKKTTEIANQQKANKIKNKNQSKLNKRRYYGGSYGYGRRYYGLGYGYPYYGYGLGLYRPWGFGYGLYGGYGLGLGYGLGYGFGRGCW